VSIAERDGTRRGNKGFAARSGTVKTMRAGPAIPAMELQKAQ
jgi:hypothetical protein